ncbi:zinc-binding alcohol dehydrogenase [Pikeienuella piscinae]|uniref:Zinc-binding alcohol dehydrogenase n=1 Tax=Pikeienuella piscinae TaxID=2748098 RepID=A0A7M3T6Z7_9RHOB|nr:zinc-binding alcohol dehydrogenase [Pikeienuella piscinae]
MWSLISRGTERLVHEGRVPESEHQRMRAPHQEGNFPFPVKYGYAMVGIVEDGPEALIGRHVFALHPHQSRFRLPADDLVPLPPGLPPRRAALAANMETALNALWDAGAGPGDRIAVVGAGLIGCLVARLAARMPGTEVTMSDPIRRRADIAAELNVNFTSDPREDENFDIAIHASATAAGLAEALGRLGQEGRLVELSWYGAGDVEVPLGAAFHSRRLSIVSSQVSAVSPSRRPRWPHRRRLLKALSLLDDPALDALIDSEVAFEELSTRLPALLARDAPGVATVIRYM